MTRNITGHREAHASIAIDAAGAPAARNHAAIKQALDLVGAKVTFEQRDRLVPEGLLHPADALVAEVDAHRAVTIVQLFAKLIEQKVHEGRQRALLRTGYGQQLLAMKVAQIHDRINQERQHHAQALEQARREKALTRVDRREIVALLRDLRARQRMVVCADSEGRMPSLEGLVRRDKRTKARAPSLAPTQRPGEARNAFEDAASCCFSTASSPPS